MLGGGWLTSHDVNSPRPGTFIWPTYWKGELPSRRGILRLPALGVFPKIGVFPPQIIHLFIGFSMIFTIQFGVFPYFWKHPLVSGDRMTCIYFRHEVKGHLGSGSHFSRSLGDENDHHGVVKHWTIYLGRSSRLVGLIFGVSPFGLRCFIGKMMVPLGWYFASSRLQICHPYHLGKATDHT